jgi:hypothetical protein
MFIEEGTMLGQMTEPDGTVVAVVTMGDSLDVCSVRGFPYWIPEKGARILFFLPTRAAGICVTKAGVRQAGAFVLCPDEQFLLKGPAGQKEMAYRFRAMPNVKAVTEDGERCAFCRTDLEHGGVFCSKGNLASQLRGKLLCGACAGALGSE